MQDEDNDNQESDDHLQPEDNGFGEEHVATTVTNNSQRTEAQILGLNGEWTTKSLYY